MTREEGLTISKDYFEQWFQSEKEFRGNADYSLSREWYNKAAFLLHQTAENLYTCLLLTHYTPSTHNIKELRSRSESIAPILIQTWPRDTKLAHRNFQLLKHAHVEARYSKHYSITREELDWLVGAEDLLQVRF